MLAPGDEEGGELEVLSSDWSHEGVPVTDALECAGALLSCTREVRGLS